MPSKFRTERIISFICSIVSLLLISFISQTFGQSTNLELVNEKLRIAEKYAIEKGYTRSHNYKTGSLNAGQAETTDIRT